MSKDYGHQISAEKLLILTNQISILVQQPLPFEAMLKESLCLLRKSLQFQHLFLYEFRENASPYLEKVAESHSKKSIKLPKHIVIDKSGLKRWYGHFKANETVTGDTQNFPRNEQKVLNSYQVASVLCVPIFFEGSFWGIIGTYHSEAPREWTAKETLLLEYFTLQLTHTLIHKKRTELLQEEKEIAEGAYKVKSRFITMVSHEIRTPMNAIIGFTNVLLHTPINKTQQDYLNTIKASGEELLNLINDILDYSSMDSGKTKKDEHPFIFREIIESVSKAFERSSAKKNLTYRLTIEKQVPELVQGDSLHLSQILEKLISNAVKYTIQGKITVNISIARKLNQLHIIQFKIEDTGIGIAPDHLESIFHEFTQEDDDLLTRKYGGAGLGLAITKKVIDLLGGELKVKSKQGKGSTFLFWLPFEEIDI